jgi:hypothetical protein
MTILSLVLSLCYGGIWIAIGILLRNHLETILTMITRKPIPDDQTIPEDYQKTKQIIDIIGSLMILIGIGTILMGLSFLVRF